MWTLLVKRKGSLDYALDHDYVVVNTARVPTTRTPKNTTERPSALCMTQTPATKFLELKEFPRKRSRENTKMFRDREQKNKRAVMILDNYQLLCKYAEANGKVSRISINAHAATRLIDTADRR